MVPAGVKSRDFSTEKNGPAPRQHHRQCLQGPALSLEVPSLRGGRVKVTTVLKAKQLPLPQVKGTFRNTQQGDHSIRPPN